MSIRLMASAWELDIPSTEKMVLLCLCDHSNDVGTCWPSVPTIAKKCSKSDRTVQAAIQWLRNEGYCSWDDTPGRPHRFTLNPRKICTPAEIAPPQELHQTPAELADEPSRTTIPKKDKPSLVKRPTRIPPDFAPVMTGKTASVVDGWPPGRLPDELEHFADHHTAKGTTSYDWQASWRTWVKNAKRWEPRNGYHGQQPVSLRGSRPDPSLDFVRQANADLAAERRGAADYRGDRTSLPARGAG